MTVTIRRDNDPFKKYWWAILGGFALVGGWVCLPMMDTSIGSGSVSAEKGLRSADQSLDSLNNPSGAPGSALDLSMDGSGAYKKKDGSTMTSSLYQPPPETAAPGEPIADEGGNSNLANALKDISRQSASASADPSGWGGAAPQKGFTGPRANFGGLSGFGGGSGSAASSSGGSGASAGSSGLGSFGSEGPKTGLASTRGLGEAKEGPQKGGKPVMKSLESASASAISAANQASNDSAAAMSARSFDGGGGGGQIGGKGGGVSGPGIYASLDAAPKNLKMNDPNLSKKEVTPPAAKEVKEPKQSMQQMIMMMLIQAVVGGVIGMAFKGIA